jgi:radical SAM protein with 4Fe4S-binding SPASM domain
VFWKRNPIHLTFFVTKRCNARCSFCFYQSNNGRADAVDELSIDEVRRISSSMGNLLWLAFSGGEIFLRNDIVELTKIFYERNRPSIILFPTNGLLTDVITERIGEILDQCKRSTIVVKLSLEGNEEVHDAIRGVSGSFQKTMQTYSALGSLIDKYPNFELGINTVFCSANQDNMDEVIEFVNGLDKIKTHTISLIRGTVEDKGLKDVEIKKYLKAVDRLASNLRQGKSSVYRFKGARVKAAQDILQRRLVYETEVKKRQLIPCYAGKLNLVLTETGDVFPCESFSMKLGNVRKSGYDMKKILQTGQAEKVLRSINAEKCFCTHECYLMTNILFNARMYPELAKEYLQLSK